MTARQAHPPRDTLATYACALVGIAALIVIVIGCGFVAAWRGVRALTAR